MRDPKTFKTGKKESQRKNGWPDNSKFIRTNQQKESDVKQMTYIQFVVSATVKPLF